MRTFSIMIAITTLLVFLLTPAVEGSFNFNTNEPLFSPAGNSTIHDSKPNITLSFGKSEAVTSSVRMIVNGKDVTRQALVTPAFISYKPEKSLPPNKNTVKVTFKSKNGKQVLKKWSFRIKPRKLIKKITHNGVSPLMANEVITVTMTGEPDCKAWFSIGSLKTNIPMKEVSEGKYRGKYIINEYDHAKNQAIIGYLQDDKGAIHRHVSKVKISVIAQLFRVKFFYPKDGDKVGRSFILKGITKPNCKVHITSRLAFKSGTLLSAKGPDTGGITARADSKGYFEKKFGFPIYLKGLRCTISAYAVDKNRNKSIVSEIKVFLEDTGKKKKS